MYVWRVPFGAFAAWVVATALLVVVSFLLFLRRRASNPVARGALVGAVIVAILPSGALLERVIGTAYDPSAWQLWSPAIVVVCLLGLNRILFSSFRARAMFDAFSLLYALANVVNFCQPGWCERYGFPLTYWYRTDAFVIVNGVGRNGSESGMAALGNLLILLLVAGNLSLWYRARASK